MKQLEAVVDGVAGKIEAVISGGQNHEQRIAQLEAEVKSLNGGLSTGLTAM